MKKKLIAVVALAYFAALAVVVGITLNETAQIKQEVQTLRGDVDFVERVAHLNMTEDEISVTNDLSAFGGGSMPELKSTLFGA